MNIIEQKLEELSRQEEISILLEERRMDELNAVILDKFIDIQKSKAIDKNKAREWKKFNLDFAKQNPEEIKRLTLKIDADYLKKELGEASIVCHEGWSFDFRVSLFGEFDSVSFSEAVFNDHCWVGAVFNGFVTFNNVTFMDLASFYESIFEDCVNFRKVIFNAGASFARAEFNGESSFEIESKPREGAEGEKYFERKSISFEGSEFTKKVEFEIRNLDIFYLSFEGAIFSKGFLFQNENSIIHSFNLKSVMFNGMTRFVPVSRAQDKKPIKNINLEYAAFRGSTIFEINLDKCPDFSKCYFFKKFFIKETWPEIDDKKIKPEDREKFLFLKRHFAAIKNHLRENQYFGYEMRAREKGLEHDLTCKFKGRFLRWFVCFMCRIASKKVRRILVARCKILSRKYCELFLFKSYKWLSCYGSSAERPLLALAFSYLYFGYYFEINNVKNPYENSFVRTLNPLYDSGKGFSTLLEFQTAVAIQSITNTILLFLIFLGIRNRFRIRN